jgi:hypothetical protein
MTHRLWLIPVLLIFAALVITGCGDDEESDQAGQTITGIGATDADWEDNHEPDPEFAEGSAYDPDPSLVPPGGDPAFSSRYYLVTHTGGRVESYEIRFAPGTSIDEAREDALAEFPGGARVDWFRTVPATKLAGACAQMQVSSATLEGELGRGPIAGLVEFSSGEAANSYNPEAVSTATLLLFPPKPPSKALGC